MIALLSFGKGNAKLGESIATFAIPAGYTCPGASECLARANRDTGRITDGPMQRYRCFSATDEFRQNVRDSRWGNLDLLREARTVDGMADLICASLPTTRLVRIHVAGDFYSNDYFLAWCEVGWRRPDVVFYAYTKSLPEWVANMRRIPSNLRLTASRGGKYDHLIEEYGLKTAEVVFSHAAAAGKGLAIDHDDSHAYSRGGSFALLVHGTQPAGSEAAKALVALKAEGFTGYSRQ